MLWFDVGIVRYTTCSLLCGWYSVLWFDVGIVRYTTEANNPGLRIGCGLM